MSRKILLPLILLVLVSVQFVFSQTVEKPKPGEISSELKKEATAFLRETAADVNNLRTLENRISLSSEMAGLMWFSDEKEARAMFQTVIGDFRQLLIAYESQMAVGGENTGEFADYSLLSGAVGQTERKFAKAIGVRQQVAKAIAEHDPQLAFEFFSDTGAAITNPTFRKRLETTDAYFEARLLGQIAEKNPETALVYGRKSLAKGFNYETLGLLKKIYDKDQEKGAAFGEDIISKLKSDASKPDSFYYLTRVLDMGSKNLDSVKGKTDKRPMFSEQVLRDLAELAAQELLKREDVENHEISSSLAQIEKILPARAAQIRQKFEIKTKAKNSTGTGTMTGNSTGIGRMTENSVSMMPPPPPGAPISAGAREVLENQNKLAENVKSLGTQKLSDEERRTVVEQSRKIIAQSGSREQRMLALTALAVQVAKLGDKELAVSLMNEVRSSVSSQPKNYRDFMEVWMLAGSFAQVDAPKAFPILEDAVFRLNETIGAFVKVGEFVDVSGEIIADGEVQIGSFGGDLTSGLLRGLGATDSTIRSLAIADFARTKDLTAKFDRTEVRILAKMLVLRSLFANDSKTKEVDADY